MLSNIQIRMNKLKIPIILSLILLSTNNVAEARWHFNGGIVEDKLVEWQHKLEVIKEGEKAKDFATLSNFEKEMSENYKVFKAYKDDFNKLVTESKALQENAKGLLSLKKKVTEELKDLYSLDFLNNMGGTFDQKFLNKNSNRIGKNHEKETMNLVNRATELTKMNEEAEKKVLSMTEDQVKGVRAENEKIALMQGVNAHSSVGQAMLANQQAMQMIANDSMDSARRTMTESIRSFNKFDTMGSKGEYNPFKENIEKHTLKRLPRFSE